MFTIHSGIIIQITIGMAIILPGESSKFFSPKGRSCTKCGLVVKPRSDPAVEGLFSFVVLFGKALESFAHIAHGGGLPWCTDIVSSLV